MFSRFTSCLLKILKKIKGQVKRPVSSFNCYSRLVTIIDKIIGKSYYKYAGRPFLIALPSFTLACYKIDFFKNRLPANVFPWLDDNFTLLICCYILIPLFISFEECIKESSKKINTELPNEIFVLFLRTLDLPVEKKLNRFLNFLKDNKGNNLTSGQTFKGITDPDKQVAQLAESIHIFFDGLAQCSMCKDVEFSTVLFRMEGNLINENWCHFPRHLPPLKALLQDKATLAHCAAKEQHSVIIEDIEEEKKKKNKSRISKRCLADTGSVICYPIVCLHTGEVPLAVRVVANKPFFHKKKKRFV